jgi:uncharacterized membrane protein YfcA
VSIELALAGAGILAAATLQSATGFGFSLVAGPVVFAVTESAPAVGLIFFAGQMVNALVLFGERRPLAVDWNAVKLATLAALPGLPLGALILRAVSDAAMRIAVGGLVCAIVVGRFVRGRREPRPAGRGTALAAGLAVGVLTTSTTTAGPPLAIWLTRARMRPAAIRDTVTVIFFTLDLIAIPVLLAIVGSALLDRWTWLLLVVPLAAVGHALGRQVFLRLPERLYEPLVLTTAFAAGMAALVSGLRA